MFRAFLSGHGVSARISRALILTLILAGVNTTASTSMANAAASCTNATSSISGGTSSVTAVGVADCLIAITAGTATWTIPSDLNPAVGFQYLVVGGGAGASRGYCGYVWGIGGGGGNVLAGTYNTALSTGMTLSVVVGTGGTGVQQGCGGGAASPGTGSAIGSLIAADPGLAAVDSNATSRSTTGGTSGNGRLGGAPAFDASGNCGSLCPGGGGGGAGAAGSGINGGTGVSSSITGVAVTYGSGGAGKNNSTWGTADTNAGNSSHCSALANTGAGGADCTNVGGNGGSGVVYIRYTPEGSPTITSLSTISGVSTGGTSTTITGTNLNGITGITVGGAAATSISVASATSASFVTPSGSNGAQSVVVTTSHGSVTAANAFTYYATLTPACQGGGSFTIVNNVVTTSSNCIGPVSVPEGVTDIGGTAFCNNTNACIPRGDNVGAVTLPSTLVTINNYAFMTSGLTSVTFTPTSNLKTIGISAFAYTSLTSFTIPSSLTSLQGAPFYNSNLLTSLTFQEPSSLTSLGANPGGNGYGMFLGTAIKTLTLPSSITSIGYYLQAPLTQLTIKGNLTYLLGTAINQGISCIINPNNYSFINNFAYTAPPPVVVTSVDQCGTPPTITSLSPATGSTAGGNTVTLTGTNLTGINKVWVNGVLATNVTSVSSTQVTFVTPASASAGAVAVWVDGPGGPALKATAFTYVGAPTITSLSTTSGSANGGTTTTITGTNLTGTSSVTVGGVAATIGAVSATTAVITTPAGTVGAQDIVLTSSGGTVTKVGAFTYLAAPTIASFSQTSGPAAGGTTITVTGSNLTGATAVTVGAVAATAVTVLSDTSVTFVTPAKAAGTYDIVLTSPGGTVTKTAAFTYMAAPTLASLSPSSGTAGGGTSTTITGTNLSGTTAVTIGGAAATLSTITATSVVVMTPVGSAGAQDVVLTTPGGSVTKTGGFSYIGLPTIASLSTNSGAIGGGTSTTITGTNLTGTTSVRVGGASATVGTVTATTVVITTPAGSAGAQDVVLTTASGSATSVGAFTYVASPTIASLSQSNGPVSGGTTVTITGSNLTGTTSVTVGAAAATGITVLSNTSVSFVAPAKTAGTYDVVLSTPGGSVTKTAAYTYMAAPTIASAAITGTAQFGQQLTATTVGVAGSSITTTYIWETSTSASGTYGAISGATGSTYTPTAGDVGTYLKVIVTVANAGGSASSTSAATSVVLSGTALNPAFGAPTSTADGFTVQISNYSSSYTWAGTATASGTVSIDGNGLVTVSGLAASTSSTATITTTRTGYTNGSSTVTKSSAIGAALNPTYGTVTPTAGGFTVAITNYSASFTWATPTVSAGSVTASAPSGSTQVLTVTGLSPGTSATITESTSRVGYNNGSSTVSGTSALSSDKSLSTLSLSSGSLSPAFASGTTSYTATVANGVSSITVTPTVNQVNATINAKVGSGSFTSITSGVASGSLSLSIGLNTVTLLVTAQDGTTGTYIINLTRSASTDSTLSGLLLSSGVLSPTFVAGTTSYTSSEANATSSITVTSTANQAYATIQVKLGSGSYSTVSSGVASSGLALSVGANTISIRVTAQDGATTTIYSIVVTRAPPTHTVLYSVGAGSGAVPTQLPVSENSSFTIASGTGISRAGYLFDKWNDGSSDYAVGANYIMGTTNVVLTATWAATLQSVTYLNGGGSGSTPVQGAVSTGSTFTTSTNSYTKAGYDFAGWSDGTFRYDAGATYTVGIANVTLTALWTPSVYTIRYDPNGATGSASRTSDSYTFGTSGFNLPTVGSLTLTGYSFGGWATSKSGVALSGAYTPSMSLTLYALWVPNSYIVAFNTNGATGAVPLPLNFTVGETGLTLPDATDLANPGYSFGGWATGAGQPPISNGYSPTGSITLQAVWTPIPYSVTYNFNRGTSSKDFTHVSQTVGSVFAVSISITRDGYIFAGWSDGTNTYSPLANYTTGTHDIVFTAVWTPLYTVHYVMNGSSTPAPADDLEASGTSVILAAAPVRDGYTFGGWLNNNISNAAGSSFTVLENSTLSAIWNAIPYSVTYSLGGAPGSAPTYGGVTVGSVFALAAAPVWSGYTFIGWSDGQATYNAGSNYLVGNMNISLTAQWSPIYYSVSYDVNGATSSVPSGFTTNVGQTFTTASTPTRSGYVFDGWNDGSSKYPAGATYTMPAANVTFTASFTAPSPTITSVSVASGPITGGTTSTITGAHFTLVTGVTVGGNAATFTINNDSSLSIVTPSGSNGLANIVISSIGGDVTGLGAFSYSLLTSSSLTITTVNGMVGTNLTLASSGGSGFGTVSFSTATSGCHILNGQLSVDVPIICSVTAVKAADGTYAQSTVTSNVTMSKIASNVSVSLPSNASFASFNASTTITAATSVPGTVTFTDDGVVINSCTAVQTSTNRATCTWFPSVIKTNKVIGATLTPTDNVNYETSTASTIVNVMASSLTGINPSDLTLLGATTVVAGSSSSLSRSTSDTVIVLTVPSDALPSGSVVNLYLDTNGSSARDVINSSNYLLNSVVAWNAPDGTIPTSSVPLQLDISNSSIAKGMVVYGIVNGVATPLGTATTNGSVTVYLTQDPLVVIAPTVPGVPTSVLASNGQNQESLVSWLAPSNNGGRPITGYTVTSSDGQTCTTTGALSCTVTGLTNGLNYTFTVTATNAVGTSAASSQSPSISPVGPPSIITPTTRLTATYNQDYSLALSAHGSSDIQSYSIGSGTLPSGLNLNSISGVISGKPEVTGSFAITIECALDMGDASIDCGK